MRRDYFFMYTLELLLLLCLSLVHLEARPNKHYGRCTFDGDNKAFCRPQDACTTLSKDEMNNENILKQYNCGEVDGKPLVCCPETLSPNKFIDEVFEMSIKQEVKLPLPPNCGSMLSDRIYNGNVTEPDEHPWMALIEITSASGERAHLCGGVLITDRWVLTAAHCELKGRISGVRLGEWNTDTEIDCVIDRYNRKECLDPYIDVPADLVKPHPDYNKDDQRNDIALVRLAHPVTLTKSIKLICLPHTPKFRNDLYENTAADICGWGRTETGQVSAKKLKATLGVWPLDRCRVGLELSRVLLHEGIFCASGDTGVSSCYGDSGGPLMHQDNNFYVIGVISVGDRSCKKSGIPVVFTRVTNYIDWIKDTLNQEQ